MPIASWCREFLLSRRHFPENLGINPRGVFAERNGETNPTDARNWKLIASQYRLLRAIPAKLRPGVLVSGYAFTRTVWSKPAHRISRTQWREARARAMRETGTWLSAGTN